MGMVDWRGEVEEGTGNRGSRGVASRRRRRRGADTETGEAREGTAEATASSAHRGPTAATVIVTRAREQVVEDVSDHHSVGMGRRARMARATPMRGRSRGGVVTEREAA